jgi:hypothetical protein
MSRAMEAYQALLEAMEISTAPCLGDDRFTDDHTLTEEVTPICDTCPLRNLCEDYARAAKPTGGIWAGRRWGQTRTKRTT